MKKGILILISILFISCGRDQTKEDNPSEVKQRQDVVENDTAGIPDVLVVEKPSKNEQISSPLKIKDRVRGSWYFEGVFPLEVISENGKVLVESYAKAQGDWMTSGYVPFSAEVKFDAGDSKKGLLILMRSNASGLPENDRSYRLPVYFK